MSRTIAPYTGRINNDPYAAHLGISMFRLDDWAPRNTHIAQARESFTSCHRTRMWIKQLFCYFHFAMDPAMRNKAVYCPKCGLTKAKHLPGKWRVHSNGRLNPQRQNQDFRLFKGRIDEELERSLSKVRGRA